jgi:hypothetical protein
MMFLDFVLGAVAAVAFTLGVIALASILCPAGEGPSR